MAGVRQHILPRFLLKGFASRESGKNQFAWVYKRNLDPFEANINNIAVEKYFYGDASNTAADDAITKLESRFAQFVDVLRIKEDGFEVESRLAAELVANIVVRTKHLRETFSDGIRTYGSSFAKSMESDANFNKFVILGAKKIKEKMRINLVSKGFPRKIIKQLMKMSPQDLAKLLGSNKQLFNSMLSGALENAFSNLHEIAKTAHQETLATSPSPELRVREYSCYCWQIKVTNSPFIIGDFGCMFEIENGQKYQSVNDTKGKTTKAILPLSTRCLLVGTSSPGNITIAEEAIKIEIARLSREYFVAPIDSQEMRYISSLIGDNTAILTDEEGDILVKEQLSKHVIK